MKKRIVSLLTVFTLVLLSAAPVFAVRLDGVNGGEYSTKEYQTLFSGKSESGNNATLAQAFIKTENTMCYILFSVVCDDVDENRAEFKDNKAAGVLITADGETFKADLTGTDYGGYDRNRFDFDYAPMVRTGGFTLEAAINFKDGIGSGKTIAVKVMDGSGMESAVRYVKIKPPEESPTASEKTTKQTTEKTTKEKTTKPTTEKTTKPTTAKTEAAKQTTAPETRTKREITHRAVTTTIKAQTSVSANTNPAKTTKAASTKFKAKQKGNTAAITEQQGTSERRTGRYEGTVTYSYITDEYTTAAGTAAGSSKTKKKIAALASATLVIAACVFGTISKKEKSDEEEKSERS